MTSTVDPITISPRESALAALPAATAYIDGAITREPYTRADLKNTAPQYYLWLANLFDGGKPRR